MNQAKTSKNRKDPNTRARAERTIARSSDPNVIKPFLSHGNKHVQHNAEYKLKKIKEAT